METKTNKEEITSITSDFLRLLLDVGFGSILFRNGIANISLGLSANNTLKLIIGGVLLLLMLIVVLIAFVLPILKLLVKAKAITINLKKPKQSLKSTLMDRGVPTIPTITIDSEGVKSLFPNTYNFMENLTDKLNRMENSFGFIVKTLMGVIIAIPTLIALYYLYSKNIVRAWMIVIALISIGLLILPVALLLGLVLGFALDSIILVLKYAINYLAGIVNRVINLIQIISLFIDCYPIRSLICCGCLVICSSLFLFANRELLVAKLQSTSASNIDIYVNNTVDSLKNRELTINDVVRRSKKYVYVSGRNKTVHWESTCLNDGGGETRSIEKTEFKRKLEQGGYSGYIACPICDRTAFYISRKKKLIHINPDCTNAIKDEVFEEVNKQELPSEYNRCKICFSLQ